MRSEYGIGKDGLKYCPVCGQKIERIMQFPKMDGTGDTFPKRVQVICRCKAEELKHIDTKLRYEEEQREINKIRKLSLMDERLKDIRFSAYEVDQSNEKIYRIAKKYVSKFENMFENGQGMLFFGDVGTGKSYTAAVIANELMERRNPVIMTSFIKLLNWESGFDDKERGKIENLNKANLLIIDDLGAERGTDYALEKVYDIIDSRYRTKKPVILTTNLDLRDMQMCTDIRYSRIYDRIFEMCYPVKFEGKSWRKKKAVERFDEMRRMLDE